MVYIRIKKRVTAREGERLKLGQVADVMADAGLRLSQMPVALPRGAGIWQVDALQLILQMQEKAPGEVVNVLGDGIGWLHREAKASGGRKRALDIARAAIACLLLFFGSALAIGWFHSDVNMGRAQASLYEAVSGKAPAGPLSVALPYAGGVLLGVLLYYALIGKKSVSPLTVKLRAYREMIEQNAGQKDNAQ